MKLCLLLALFFLSQSFIVPYPFKMKARAPRTYKVQISDPPEVRWAPMVHDYRHFINKMMDEVTFLNLPDKFYELLDWYAHKIFSHQDMVREIDALSKLTGFPFGQFFFLNFMYEFSTIKACSTILVRTGPGKVMHGRNLDFPMMRLISGLLINVEYYDGHRRVFSIDTVLGTVFALTGMRDGAFAVNCDTRYTNNNIDILKSVFIYDAIPDVWLLRRVLAEQTNYHDALHRLKTTRIGAPVYFIISGVGPNEGAVIERNPDGVHATYELSDTTWFLVQSNYDRDHPDPWIDPRRVPVENRMRQHGQVGMTQKVLMQDFMMLWPTMNIGTIMTAVMTPATSYKNTSIWWNHNPSSL